VTNGNNQTPGEKPVDAFKAIADTIARQLREGGVHARHHDGYPHSRWVVIDYGDVIIHIFHPELRERYGLEHLWGDAKRVK